MQKPQTCELPIVSIVLPFLTDHKYEVGKPENERNYNDCIWTIALSRPRTRNLNPGWNNSLLYVLLGRPLVGYGRFSLIGLKRIL